MVAVVDFKISEEAKALLSQYGYKVIAVPPHSKLASAISSHPDMLIFAIDNKLITSKIYYKENCEAIDEIVSCLGFELIFSNKEIGEKYPNDVIFNAALVGKYLIANIDFIADEILSLATKNNIKCVNIKQGYSKCSVCIVSDNAVITADSGIYKVLSEETDLDILKIGEGFVVLPPYDYGFIGGASGTDSKNVYFCGDLNTHPDGDKIRAFCQKHSKNAVSLLSGKLMDVGTIFLFE